MSRAPRFRPVRWTESPPHAAWPRGGGGQTWGCGRRGGRRPLCPRPWLAPAPSCPQRRPLPWWGSGGFPGFTEAGAVTDSQQQFFLDQRPVPQQGPPPGLGSGQGPRDGRGPGLLPPAERAERAAAQVGLAAAAGGRSPGLGELGSGVPEVRFGLEAAGRSCWRLFSEGADG